MIEPEKAILDLPPSLDTKEQVDVYRDLLTDTYPKRKAVELSAYPETQNQFKKAEVDYVKFVEMIKIASG